MSKLFPFRSTPDLGEREPRLVDLDEAAADEVFDALGSETARTLLLELHAEPRPASELAEAVDTTVQNVQYHLTKLEAADLVTQVDTWYSESGTEMAVYAPADEALVLFAGERPERSLRRLLERLVGAVAVLAAGGAAVALAVGWRGATGLGASGPEPQAANASTTPMAAEGGGGAAGAAGGAGGVVGDPLWAALAFVCGGLVALAALVVVDRVL